MRNKNNFVIFSIAIIVFKESKKIGVRSPESDTILYVGQPTVLFSSIILMSLKLQNLLPKIYHQA